MSIPLEDERIDRFTILIEEASRSTDEGIKFFVEPASGVLSRAKSKRHHFVFGRRGSGKSSLIAKVEQELTLERTPVARVDLEPFKGHSYPDLLISVLLATIGSFQKWLETYATVPATKTSLWTKVFGAKPTGSPLKKEAVAELVTRLKKELVDLETQLYMTDQAEVQIESEQEEAASKETKIDVKVSSHGVSAGVGQSKTSTSNNADRAKESFKRAKVDFLRRRVLVYQKIFDDLKTIAGCDAYLLLDDLYHIRRAEQASVVDYMHSIGKGHGMWLKVGTIRHRSTWYVHENPPVGMKLGDDADEINLDLTLEKYRTTKDFLVKILSRLLTECDLKSTQFLTDGTIDRLVIASGGVARDFLGILRRSIAFARERDNLENRPRVGAEDVNMAAGEYDSTKRDEFKKDTYSDEEIALQITFDRVRDFCLDTANSNCFLVEQSATGPEIDSLNELVDLKLLHRIRSRVTVNTATQKGKLFEAYMLDLSQYSASRKRRGLEIIEFWTPGSELKLRKASLIFATKAK
ncbi:hypothetical protein N9L06_00970 [Mariniblastus sp.]|nr:hypothetical protein [Mariniblastus sp.]